MPLKATTPEAYIAEMPDNRKAGFTELRKTILQHLPKGFSEVMAYGMIGYVVPHSIYPAGYHANKSLPLPFMNIGSQKNYIVMHHLGLYGDTKLLEWFTTEYPKHSKTKLDMGKGCVRFKNPEQIPSKLIGELVKKIDVKQWIKTYESQLLKGKGK